MLLSDGELRDAVAAKRLVIEPFDEHNLQPASYEMRLGPRAMISGHDREIDVSKDGNIIINPGQFALLTTLETLQMPKNMAGHLALKTSFARRGLVPLAGLQIDPAFYGILVIGVFNAAPRRVVLDYGDPFLVTEFHELRADAIRACDADDEQMRGHIPRVDRDYLRELEVESLTELGKSVKNMTLTVSSLADGVQELKETIKGWVVPVIVGLLVLVVAVAVALFRK